MDVKAMNFDVFSAGRFLLSHPDKLAQASGIAFTNAAALQILGSTASILTTILMAESIVQC
jgi:hypothetical protein